VPPGVLGHNGRMPKIATVALVVREYDEAIAFFVGSLGFTLLEDSDMGDGKRWVVVAPPPNDEEDGAVSGATLLLARAVSDQQRAAIGTQGGGRVWLFLHTDDFARDHARMVAAGVLFREEPRHEPYGTVAVFEDLYGNPWDLLQISHGSEMPA
jgi:catechol 2,3-dioxygenase-like lactoylglutathione lyase family enzyme